MTTAGRMPGRTKLAREVMATAGAAVGWWTGELVGLLPARLRRASGTSLIVEATPTGLLVGRDTLQGWETLAAFEAEVPGKWVGRQGSAEPAGAMLRLPANLVLARTITLAAAAAENLHEVVGFQLDRYTPFELEEVYLGCRVVGHDPDAEVIDVAVAVVPRADVKALFGAAASRGIACTRVFVADGASGGDLELDLGTSEDTAPAGRWRRLLWVAAAVLLVLDLAVPLVRGHARLGALQHELAVVRSEAQAVAALRNEVDQAVEQAAIPVQRWRRTPLSMLLTELTRLVPDTGWVTQMQIDSNTVQLTGYSASANALIPILEQSQLLANAAFRSPVTQDPVHGVEQFHLSVDLRRPGE
jgi:general secretion pathway protein L